jgi:DNA modification methylase
LRENIPIKYRDEFKKLVNFSTNLDVPIHRWFEVKEGYSQKLIFRLVNEHTSLPKLIFDPFAGGGTTLLAAKEIGISSFGFEVNPFLAFGSKVKLTHYFPEDIKKLTKIINIIKNLRGKPSIEPPKLSISTKLFRNNLQKILLLKEFILNLDEEQKIKDLVFLAFLSILEECSIAIKSGNGLKYPKNKKQKDPVLAIVEKLRIIEEDLNKIQKNEKFFETDAQIFNEDVRSIGNLTTNMSEFLVKDLVKEKEVNIKEFQNEVDLAIFSPPYLNCFDYTEVYKMELWFGDFVKNYEDVKKMRELTLISHLNQPLNSFIDFENTYVNFFVKEIQTKEIWSKKIPVMIKGYFRDMYKVLTGLYELLRSNGKCIIVVGNSAYANIIIPTDLLLAKIGKEIGFSNPKIYIARKLPTSSQQLKKVNTKELLRESLVIMEKS